MILIIPALDIRNGKCLRRIKGATDLQEYSDDPVKTAVLWRGENAKSIHIIDNNYTLQNLDLVQKIVNTIDIPIQIEGEIKKFEDVERAIQIGVYRVVLDLDVIKTPELILECVKKFGERKISLRLDVENGELLFENSHINLLDIVKLAKEKGLCRVFFTNISHTNTLSEINLNTIKKISEDCKMSVTVAGGISGFQDLIHLQELQKFGVDSVVIGRALIENAFACQLLWRKNEEMLEDYRPTRRI